VLVRSWAEAADPSSVSARAAQPPGCGRDGRGRRTGARGWPL